MNKIKTSILFLVTVLTVGFFWAFVSENSYRSRATTDQALVYFGSVLKNNKQELLLPIMIQSDPTQKVSGAQITVAYDKTKVNFTSTSETSSTCQSLSTSVKINNASDEGKLSWTKVETGDSLPGTIPFCFATLKFKMISTGMAKFNIEAASSEVIGPGPKTYTVTTNDNSAKTVTITDNDLPAVTNVILNLKLKFQGVTKLPASGQETIDVLVKLVSSDGTISSEDTGSFTSDSNGIWSGSVGFNATASAGYKVFVKGPKHIQKRVCDATPTETSPGTYHCDKGDISIINTSKGTNAFNFSGIYMLVGDLPDQDGVVNSYDTSLVRNNLAKADANTLQLADLNFDGIVDTQDYSLIISALSIRGDEGE